MGRVVKVSVIPVNSAALTGEIQTAKTSEILRPELKELNTHLDYFTFTPDLKFPITGFKGATFKVILKNVKAERYEWVSDAGENVEPVVETETGSNVVVVTMNGRPGNKTVTITGTPQSGDAVKYSFTLNYWFIITNVLKTWTKAQEYCSTNYSGGLPAVAQMSQHTNFVASQERGRGALWSEWRNMKKYGYIFGVTWSSGPVYGKHYYVNPNSGTVGYQLYTDEYGLYVVCRQGL